MLQRWHKKKGCRQGAWRVSLSLCSAMQLRDLILLRQPIHKAELHLPAAIAPANIPKKHS